MIARLSAGSVSRVGIALKGNLLVVTEPPPARLASGATICGALGLETTGVGPDGAGGRFRVDDRVRGADGAVQGGAYAAIAEALATRATASGLDRGEHAVTGLSSSVSVLLPVRAGVVESQARARHRGRTTWLWEVDYTDSDGRLCALARVTVAIRPDGA